MSYDVLTLGPVEFDGFETPADMGLGVSQNLVVHKMPGGSRVIDAMGADDDDRTWSGTFLGENATALMLTLYTMTRLGQPLPFSWGAEGRTAVLTKFNARVVRWGVITYSLTLTLDDDGDSGSLIPSAGSLVAADLQAAVGALS